IQQVREPHLLRARRKKFTRFIEPSCGRKACDLAFDERQLEATDARRFSCTVNLRHSRLLKFINTHSAAIDCTTSQLREFHIRHKMKSASEIIARNLPTFPAPEQRNTLEFVLAVRRQRPTPTQIVHAAKLPFQTQRLCRFTKQSHTEPRESR